ncbi:MAG: hypothetical protein RLY78_2377 [Pseudomonadota bacterium]
MTVEIRVRSVKPLRQSFTHLAQRFGDKPASRYQEGAYDIQSTTNFHYKPLWDPERDLWDARRTALTMADWYALKDPRQYYYGSWTIARARQQDAADRQLEMVEQRGQLARLPEPARHELQQVLLPLRHVEWAANTNFAYVSAYGYGTALTQAAAMAMMDRLGQAQHHSRIGLLLDGQTGRSLAEAKRQWLAHPAWQPLRGALEASFVSRDWAQTLLAQTLCDTLLHSLLLRDWEADFSHRHGSAVLATVLDFPLRWHEDHGRWIDALLKTLAAENEANRAQLADWAGQWGARLGEALVPIAELALGSEAPAALDRAREALARRLSKAGIVRG